MPLLVLIIFYHLVDSLVKQPYICAMHRRQQRIHEDYVLMHELLCRELPQWKYPEMKDKYFLVSTHLSQRRFRHLGLEGIDDDRDDRMLVFAVEIGVIL